ncbi:MAG: enoyl-CoA hydratase/isomerase family protein [Hyphomicrobiaceae bacterium]
MNEKAGDEAGEDIAIVREGAVARIVLKRVKALNALTTAMRTRIAEAIPVLARDASLYAVAIQSESPKAFSAGGDVREIVSWGASDPDRAAKAFADEYLLDWTLECFSKPTVSLVNGMVMGSGVGISIYNTHRVAGAGYRFAMPETAIGLFPDVGVAHVLARLPGEIGTYLGLTGRSIGRADAYRLGLVTHCIPGESFAGIVAALSDAQPIDPLLDGLHVDPGAGELAAMDGLLAVAFAGDSVEQIVSRLESVSGAGKDFAAGVLADLAKRSPTSLKITLRHLRAARRMDLRNVLIADQRLAVRCLQGHDFAEGVRAALIDKDNRPVWSPASLAEVNTAEVDRYFAPLPEGQELMLPSREEMQAARV